MTDALITSLIAAVAARPDDVDLRLHVAELLLAAGRMDEALHHAGTALAQEPQSAAARQLIARCLGQSQPAPSESPAAPPNQPSQLDQLDQPDPPKGFDWSAAEEDVDGLVPPMYVDGQGNGAADDASLYQVEHSPIRLADVGGLTQVKQRLEASFLAPLRNPELRRMYGKSLRGGLLLYGPPGCGKTFLAKAVAGELGASFLHVSLADVLDMYIGQSEKNVHDLFELARRSAPCVVFLDELDAIGQKRSLTRNSGMRTTVNQLLTELDGVGSDNDGVFVLAATNHPWDVDPALRRPGRLDRMLLVLPPDLEAREAILRTHLKDRPIERIDTRALAKQTDGLSGADLAHLCETAAEYALLDSVATGTPRMISMADFRTALPEVRPSIGPWLDTASNVALYANSSGDYDDLAAWLRKHKRR